MVQNLDISNKGNTQTFMSSRYDSVIDLAVITPSIYGRIKNWQVSDEETLSDHKLIEFTLSHAKITPPTYKKP